MPWEIGKPQAETANLFENYNSFVGVISANVGITSNSRPPGVAQFNGQELDIHPLTGSWGQSWSSRFETDFLPSGSLNFNQAFIGYTAGSPDTFWNFQAGLLPNFLGYGSFDRSLAVSLPLVLSTSARNPQLDTLFNWSGPRAAGLTVSYWLGDTLLSASARDRLSVTAGGLDALGTPSTNHIGDALLALTHFFDQKGAGSALGLTYYKGQTHLNTATGSGLVYANNFSHLIGSVNYYITESMNAYLGGGWGQDQLFNAASGNADQRLFNSGIYGGLEYFWSGELALGGRYDHVRTDLNTAGTDLSEATLYLHYRPINQIIFASELQFVQNGLASSMPGLDQSVLTAQATVAY